jgi:hypothetical protein
MKWNDKIYIEEASITISIVFDNLEVQGLNLTLCTFP